MKECYVKQAKKQEKRKVIGREEVILGHPRDLILFKIKICGQTLTLPPLPYHNSSFKPTTSLWHYNNHDKQHIQPKEGRCYPIHLCTLWHNCIFQQTTIHKQQQIFIIFLRNRRCRYQFTIPTPVGITSR